MYLLKYYSTQELLFFLILYYYLQVKKAVDVAHKIITGVAAIAAMVVTKILFGGDGSDNKDEDKNKED